jgi:hypothetical protein
MTSSDDFRRDAAVFRDVDGSLIVGIYLDERRRGTNVRQLIADARAIGADAIWVHGAAVDTSLGFVGKGAYVLLQAPAPPAPLNLPEVPEELVHEMQRTCFAGVWGRHEPGALDPAATFVGLHEAGRWTGVCAVRADARWIDGPGVLPLLRTPERYAHLVRGAAAHLPRNRPLTLETWGDTAETLAAYRTLGFEIVESLPGWELRL